MAIQLGSAYGKVGLDIKGLLAGVKQGKAGMLMLADAGQALGAGMKNVGNMLTLGLTLPIAALGAASIKAASDFEETKNKAVVVFADMADSVVANANKAGTALGISKTQYLDYAASIGAALKAGGMGVEQSTKLAEQAVKHFSDLASFHNARVEDVATAWQSAIRGQYEPIQRYFPFITDSYLKTYGIANGMLDANTKTLTANQRAVILNAIALNEELNPALDDFAETSGGLANQGRIMRAQWQNALVMLGQNLLPIALKVVTALNRMLEAFNNMSPFQQKVILGFLALAAAAGPVLSILGTLVSFASGIAGLATTLSGLGISFAGVGTAITATVIPALVALGTALAPILLVLAAIAVAIGILYVIWKFNIFGMRTVFNNAISVMKKFWQAFMAFLHGDTEGGLAILSELFANFKANIAKIFDFSRFTQAWTNFMNWLRNALTQARNFISTAFSNVDWGKVGKFILMGLANGMLLGLPNLLLIAKRIADSLLKQIKTSLGIKSPSAEAMKLGKFTAQGFQMGLQSVSPDALARSLTRPITNSTSTQQTIVQHFASGVTLQQARSMIAENNEQLMNTIIGALSG